jgi:hypothetical protein
MLRATFKSRSRGYPELAPLRLLRKNEDMIGGGGSIASTLGTENTSFATGYAPPYSEERERLEHRLREVHYEREQCWRR